MATTNSSFLQKYVFKTGLEQPPQNCIVQQILPKQGIGTCKNMFSKQGWSNRVKPAKLSKFFLNKLTQPAKICFQNKAWAAEWKDSKFYQQTHYGHRRSKGSKSVLALISYPVDRRTLTTLNYSPQRPKRISVEVKQIPFYLRNFLLSIIFEV